jgi:hypothetical protein
LSVLTTSDMSWECCRPERPPRSRAGCRAQFRSGWGGTGPGARRPASPPAACSTKPRPPAPAVPQASHRIRFRHVLESSAQKDSQGDVDARQGHRVGLGELATDVRGTGVVGMMVAQHDVGHRREVDSELPRVPEHVSG